MKSDVLLTRTVVQGNFTLRNERPSFQSRANASFIKEKQRYGIEVTYRIEIGEAVLNTSQIVLVPWKNRFAK